MSHSTGLRPSILLPPGEGGARVGREEVDMGEIEVVTEFVSEENKEELHKVSECVYVCVMSCGGE